MAQLQELPSLSAAELTVMKVLWRAGRQSAREIHEQVAEPSGWAYSTTRTTLDRLVQKGHVVKAPFHGLHLYQAAITPAAGLARLVRDFATRVLEISPAPVVCLFAESEALSDQEIEELKELLDRWKEE